jgi:hypothetical protein
VSSRDHLSSPACSLFYTGDGAADLLQQLTADAPAAAENRPTAEAAIRSSRGRSGGIVDAPGKKHRPPMPTDPGANHFVGDA